jgi:hypothetical protein
LIYTVLQCAFLTYVFFSVTHSSNMFYSVVFIISMFLIVTHWYTQFAFPRNLFFSVTHSSNMFYSVVFIIFYVSHCNTLIYTVLQCPFTTYLFLGVTYSSNMFYSVVFIIFMFLIVSHWYTQFPFPKNVFFSVLTHLICSTLWFLSFSMFLIVTQRYTRFYNVRFQCMCISV